MKEPRPSLQALETGEAVPPELANLFDAAFRGSLAAVERALAAGAEVNTLDPATGLSALHMAIGHNDLALCQLLVEQHSAAFGADRFGRWPSVVAIECRASEELAEYVVTKEAQFLALQSE